MTKASGRPNSDSLELDLRLDQLCDDFEYRWIKGENPAAESYLAMNRDIPESVLISELLPIEVHHRRARGESFVLDEYQARFPHLSLSYLMTHDPVGQVDRTSQWEPSDSSMPSRVPTDPEELLKPFLEVSERSGWLGRLGHFEIDRVLGQGGFGIVVKAFDGRLHRDVAIKFLRPDLALTSPPRKRFLREARAVAALRHDNIVGIYAVEESPLPYLVMEYIHGMTLQQWLDENGPLETVDFLTIGVQIAAGLGAAHRAHLIHRDIKPSNVLLDADSRFKVRITDFGLARSVDDASMTVSGIIAGTPMYMSPEQARGESLDNRSDLFSLGSVLYQTISGRPPFRAPNTIAVLKRVCDDNPRSIQEIVSTAPSGICQVIAKLMAKAPADRYQSADELSHQLESYRVELQTLGVIADVRPQNPFVDRRNKSPFRWSKETFPKSLSGWLSSPIGWIGLILLASASVLNLNYNRKTNSPHANVDDGQVIYESGSTRIESTSEESYLAYENSPLQGWQGWPNDAPSPAKSPFSTEQAKRHQCEWADFSKISVEYTNSLGMKFRLIPPGEFTMGSSQDEIEEALRYTGNSSQWQGFIRSESPQHKVILSKPIYLGVTEVTQHQYEQVMGTNPSFFSPQGKGKDKVVGMDTRDHPVEYVDWGTAVDFCKKLSQRERLASDRLRSATNDSDGDGMSYRLPTEAEWEFACRAGTTTLHWTGDTQSDLKTSDWFDGNHDKHSHAVAVLKENPFGLFDMHGNVSEWVHDGWSRNYYEKFQSRAALNPKGAIPSSTLRMTRGGCFANNASAQRSAARYAFDEKSLWTALGFRVALDVQSQPTKTP